MMAEEDYVRGTAHNTGLRRLSSSKTKIGYLIRIGVSSSDAKCPDVLDLATTNPSCTVMWITSLNFRHLRVLELRRNMKTSWIVKWFAAWYSMTGHICHI
jgi:hypothetical protein